MGILTFQKHCEWCGASFIAQKASTRFCSHTCASRAYKAKKRNELHQSVSSTYIEEEREKETATFDNVMVMTPRMAAKYLGIGKTTLYRYIGGGQIKTMKLAKKTLIRKDDLDALFTQSPNPLLQTAAQVASVVREEPETCFDDVYTSRQIMELMGMSLAGVCKILNKENVKRTKVGCITYYDKIHVDRIIKKRKRGEHSDITEWYSTSDIIKKFGMTQTAVYSMAFDFGIPKKKSKGQTFYSKLHVDAVKNKASVDLASADTSYLTIPDLMAKYDMSRDRVDHYLRYYKVPRIKVGKIVKVSSSEFDAIFRPGALQKPSQNCGNSTQKQNSTK